MSITKGLLAELQHEAISTRKMLERIPADKFDYKPHEKSMSMGKLATHIAEIPGYIAMALKTDEVDFAARQPATITTTEELVALYERNVAAAREALESAADEDLMKKWVVRRGERVIIDLPKAVAIRNMAKNHLVHHRGQLSVYLRMNDIPVPGVYGPTADER